MKLIITEPMDFSPEGLKILKKKFEVISLDNISKLSEYIHTANILFVRLGIVFSREILSNAPNLKVICTPTTGLDHIDLDFCKENNIKIISLKNEREFLNTIPSTAEHTWTLLMAINRKLNMACEHTKLKQWNRNIFKSFNLKGKTLGILGLGRVGKQVAHFGNSFGMTVKGYDTNQSIKIKLVQNVTSVEELFKISDFISIHIPLNDSNIKFVNQNLIDLMKQKACIINTSRGKVWDEEAIAQALIKKRIRGVATDVIYKELSSDYEKSPLFSVDQRQFNCIITPHIAGATFDSMQMTEDFIIKKLMTNVC